MLIRASLRKSFFSARLVIIGLIVVGFVGSGWGAAPATAGNGNIGFWEVTVEVDDSGSTGSADGGGGGEVGSACYLADEEIPCSRDGGWWDGRCYVNEVDPLTRTRWLVRFGLFEEPTLIG
jgi:hypothetical protein